MYKYKYVGTGIIAFVVDGKRYEMAYNHPTLPDTIEFDKKVKVNGLRLVEEEKKRKSTKTDRGD